MRVCPKCMKKISEEELAINLYTCYECGYYMFFHAKQRIMSIADENTFHEWKIKLEETNINMDKDYVKKMSDVQKQYNLKEAIIIGDIKINGIIVAIGIMDARFMMASMGRYVGESVTYLFERARKRNLPVIMFCCSGGVRIQEGILALMQMGKTAAAVKKHSNAGLLYISVLTNPTMGGVTASFSTMADIILAEKGAMIGFAGARVIEQSVGEKSLEEIQSAEFALEHGFVDMVLSRQTMKKTLMLLMEMHNYSKKKRCMKKYSLNEERYCEKKPIEAWEKVRIARHSKRPTSIDYINNIFSDFIEMKGDRISDNDHAIIAGIAKIENIPVTIIGIEKGKNNIQQARYYNWGMPSPSGYRKALRLMKQAEKFGRPIVCFIDTIGAACGKEAEENGQASAIANLLEESFDIATPILAIIVGEAYSGGALALCIGNEVWMLENAVYSVLSPEAYSSIKWKNSSNVREAANVMQLDSESLCDKKIVDKVFFEGIPITKENMKEMCKHLSDEIVLFINKYEKKSSHQIITERYRRFRKY